MQLGLVLQQYLATTLKYSTLTGITVFVRGAAEQELLWFLLAALALVTILFTGLGALVNMVYLLLGYAVLRSSRSDAAYHTTPINVLRVAAAGGATLYLIGSVVTAPLLYLLRRAWLGKIPDSKSRLLRSATVPAVIAIETANAAAAGALGARLFRGVGWNDIDPLHAARMGAVGAAISSLIVQCLILSKRDKPTGAGNVGQNTHNTPNGDIHLIRAQPVFADVERGQRRIEDVSKLRPGAQGGTK